MPRSRTLRPRLVALVALAALTLAAACGSDPEPTATVASTAPAADAGTPFGADEPDAPDAPDEPTEPDTGGEPADPLDACTLLTADDAAEALGDEVEPGPVQEAEECEWTTADDRTVQVALISDDVDLWREAHAAYEPVEGLGDEAYYGPVFDDVSFLVDGQIYEVDVELRGDGDGEEVAIALAEVVLARV
ncbi:hypothetical protein PO878_20395 [Iamia majanohamensis]|uniref:DUF3558 domain-containing protein n=1 Tax=Iamia majanohamensis TaxID=467976 RepID=A0AAE9Y5J2_9ACTN|nr:hypothetical protein [Iamia majanohamensis]WCO66855.1 hypothetical protein PO878_20395 [Iamia majanohamensis]